MWSQNQVVKIGKFWNETKNCILVKRKFATHFLAGSESVFSTIQYHWLELAKYVKKYARSNAKECYKRVVANFTVIVDTAIVMGNILNT